MAASPFSRPDIVTLASVPMPYNEGATVKPMDSILVPWQWQSSDGEQSQPPPVLTGEFRYGLTIYLRVERA
jgi:hypothetical protein